MSLPPSSIPRSCRERYQHGSEKNQMIEPRKERVHEPIRSLKSVKVPSRALGGEGTALENTSSSSTKCGAGKSRKMQPIFCAKTGTHLKRHRHMKLAVGDDSHAGTRASTARRRAWQAGANARLTGR